MSSFMQRLKDQMAGIVRPLQRKDKAKHCIVTNRFDDRAWKAVRPTRPVDSLISDLVKGNVHLGGTRKPYDPAPELVHDLFMALYRASPRLEEARQMRPESYPNHRVVSEVLANESLTHHREVTAGDPVMSAIALESMGEVLRDIIGRVPEPPPPPTPPPPPADGKPDDQGDGSQDGDQQPGQGAGDGQGGQDADQAADEAQEVAEADWRAAFDELLDDLDLERAMQKALDVAGDEIADLEALRKNAGLEDGEWKLMSPEQRLQMAAWMRTPAMKLLIDRVGRMRRFALGERATRVVNVPQEIYDVETGRDLKRVLPSQYALLGNPLTQLEFFRRFDQGALLQYAMHGEEEIGKGPIVIGIDKSTSMKGEPMAWAMGVGESLRRFAAEEDRDYTAFFFGTNADRHRFDFPAGKGPFEQVMAFLSVAADGGTQFDGVLDEMLQLASASFDDESKPKADLVFLTDGEARLSDAWIDRFNAERARTGVRMFSVYIGGARDMAHKVGPLALLDRISDVVIPVRELRPESARLIFSQV